MAFVGFLATLALLCIEFMERKKKRRAPST